MTAATWTKHATTRTKRASAEPEDFDPEHREKLKGLGLTLAAAGGATMAVTLGLIDPVAIAKLWQTDPQAATEKLVSAQIAAAGITQQGYQFPGVAGDLSGLAPGFQYYNSETGQMHFADGAANANRTVNAWKDFTGAPFVTVSPVGTAQGYPTNNGANFGPDTAGTDTSGWNEALAKNLPVYPSIGVYNLTGEIVPDKTLIIHGPSIGLPNSGGFVDPINLEGVVILNQMTAGVSIIHVTKPLQSTHLEGVVGRFANASTGHGLFIDAEVYFNAHPPNLATTAPWMVQGGRFEHLYFWGSDASHYAYWFENLGDCTIDTIFWGSFGGFIKTRSYIASGATGGTSFNMGNTAWQGYFQGQLLGPSATVDLISFDAVSNQAGVTTQLNTVGGGQGWLDCLLGASLNGKNLIYVQDLVGQQGALGILLPPLVSPDISASIGPVPIYLGNGTGAAIVSVGGPLPANVTFTGQGPGITLPGSITLLTSGGNATINATNGVIVLPNVGVDGFDMNAAGAYMRTNPYPPNTLTLTANPPVSGTVYQNTTGTNIYIYVPVTFTGGAAGSLVPALGPTSTPVSLPTEDEPSAITANVTRTYVLRVPAFWYYSFTVVNATLGTAVVVGE